LSTTLVVVFTLVHDMKQQVHAMEAHFQPLIHSDFDLEPQCMKLHMMGQVIKVLAPFLAFTKVYSPSKAHNMMAIMLDPCHKTMKVITEYIGDFQASSIVENMTRKWCCHNLSKFTYT